MKIQELIPSTVNEWADYWRYTIGVNVIPADTKNKMPSVKWSQYQNFPVPEEQHNLWKSSNSFSKGMAIIPGKVWHNPGRTDLYLVFLDLDNKRAIEEFCTRNGNKVPLDQIAKRIIVEQHIDDQSKAHAYFYSRHAYMKKSSDRVTHLLDKIDRNEIPALEVKGLGEHGLAFSTPSMHKNGFNYTFVEGGTMEPEIFDDLDNHIDCICKKYNIPYIGRPTGQGPTILNLFEPETRIYEGHNRHEALLRVMESLLKRNSNILELEQIRRYSHDWNVQHCVPPLEYQEEERQWKDAIIFIQNHDEVKNKNLTYNTDQDKKQSVAEIIVELANKNIKLFFRDQYGATYAQITLSDHNEIVSLESSKFRRYLAKLFYDNCDRKVINSDALNNSIQILQAKAEFESPVIQLSLRVTTSSDKSVIYYDLTDEKRRYVEIRKDGWNIVNDAQVLFSQFNQMPQVEPKKNVDEKIFDKFLNLTNVKDEQNRLLLKVYIVSMFIPEIAHPILLLHGEKGSAKSTLQTLIKLLVDPSKPSLLTIQNDKNEFIQQLAHNYVTFYDNVNHNPTWLSDEACKAVTGIGHTKRKLYTNDEDIVYEYKRCLSFNGINISMTEPDALDRSIMIELQRIRKELRQVESCIYEEFEKLKPELLGYIFDTLSKSIQIKETIKLQDLPRMAEFALWGEAIARALNYEPLRFINAYYENIGRQNIEALEANQLGQALIKLFDELGDSHQTEWYSSTAECLVKLNEIAGKNNMNTDSRSWPKSTNSFSRSINRIRSNLLEGLGIDISVARITTENSKYKKNTSIIRMAKIPPLS